jgi:CheY-like chemotaxis protein
MILEPVTLDGRSILLVEDDYLIAMDVEASLQADGAQVIGPAATVPAALALISRTEDIDAAILDINLRGTTSYAIADALQARGVPLIFVTGYDERVVPARYTGIPVCQKPFDLSVCTRLLFG